MSTAEEGSGTVKAQSGKTLTLTQDLDGNLILHCPQNETDEIDPEDIVGPPSKRLRLSSEHEHSITETTPCISVVALPCKSVAVEMIGVYTASVQCIADPPLSIKGFT
ncbi:hypothetical protein FKM82_012883 [Ascaphus truei]